MQKKLKQHSKSKVELSNEMTRATIFSRGTGHTPSPTYLALVDALVRDGWTTYAKEAQADREAWAAINRIEGRYVGGPLPVTQSSRANGGSVNTYMGVVYASGSHGYNDVVESLIDGGWASQGDVDRAEAAAADMPSYEEYCASLNDD